MAVAAQGGQFQAGEPKVAHRGLITAFAMMATLMQVLDATIANVALPYMQGSLGTTADEITWVLTSYVIAAAIMTGTIASPSRPSVRLTALPKATITNGPNSR